MVEALQEALTPVLDSAKAGPILDRIDKLVADRIPVLIYFENYGILDSAVWLPRFLDDQTRDPTNPRIRTIGAMFRHVRLDPKNIAELGNEEAQSQRRQGYPATPEMIANDQRRKEERAIRLNSASLDISTRFSERCSQRRHKIRYHADGDYFPIWVADDRRLLKSNWKPAARAFTSTSANAKARSPQFHAVLRSPKHMPSLC
jgi:hypothetical protein